MIDLLPHLESRLSPEARTFFDGARLALAKEGKARLDTLFPQISRRLGRAGLGAARTKDGDIDVDLGAWRLCDAGGAALLAAAENANDETLVDLYLHGDMEERSIVLRSLALRPVTAATLRLLDDVQRTNTGVHVEAGALDSNLVVRAFDDDAFRRMVLKIAFMDLPVWRMFGALDHADAELSGMLLGYATEREAAGRTVWLDTYRFIGRAPAEGAVARLLGGIEHGNDAVRLAAAEGLRDLKRPDLAPFLEERLPREPREGVRALLQETLAAGA